MSNGSQQIKSSIFFEPRIKVALDKLGAFRKREAIQAAILDWLKLSDEDRVASITEFQHFERNPQLSVKGFLKQFK